MICCDQRQLFSTLHTDVEVGNSRNSTQDVAWGPLVFEARRFVELRKKSLWQQFLSAESFGMGLFYTLNVSPPASAPRHLMICSISKFLRACHCMQMMDDVWLLHWFPSGC